MKTSEKLKLRFVDCSFTCEGDDGTLIAEVALLEDVVEATCHGHKPPQTAVILREWARRIIEKQRYKSTLTDFLGNIADALAKLENTNEQ